MLQRDRSPLLYGTPGIGVSFARGPELKVRLVPPGSGYPSRRFIRFEVRFGGKFSYEFENRKEREREER